MRLFALTMFMVASGVVSGARADEPAAGPWATSVVGDFVELKFTVHGKAAKRAMIPEGTARIELVSRDQTTGWVDVALTGQRGPPHLKWPRISELVVPFHLQGGAAEVAAPTEELGKSEERKLGGGKKLTVRCLKAGPCRTDQPSPFYLVAGLASIDRDDVRLQVSDYGRGSVRNAGAMPQVTKFLGQPAVRFGFLKQADAADLSVVHVEASRGRIRRWETSAAAIHPDDDTAAEILEVDGQRFGANRDVRVTETMELLDVVRLLAAGTYLGSWDAVMVHSPPPKEKLKLGEGTVVMRTMEQREKDTGFATLTSYAADPLSPVLEAIPFPMRFGVLQTVMLVRDANTGKVDASKGTRLVDLP